MGDLEKSGLELELEGLSDFLGGLGQVNEGMGGMNRAAEIAGGGLDVLSEIATGALRRIGEVAVDALGKAAQAATTFFVDSFSGALEDEQTLARLNRVIESTGGIAGLTSEAAQVLADKFATLAGGSGDVVLAIEEMALRMGTVSAEEMPGFIQTTLDLAAVTGIDAVAAARLLAQAQEDPISALTRFRRMGILFTETQEEQVKAMVASGDTAGATAIIMDRLGEATGGAAQANLNTLAGGWDLFKTTLAEAGESAVASLLPALHDLFDTIIAPNIPVITEFGGALGGAFASIISGDLGGAIDTLAQTTLVTNLLGALGLTKEQFYSIGPAIEGFVTGAQTQFAAFMVAVQPIIDAAGGLAAAFIESMPMIMTHVQGMVDFVQGLIATFGPTIVANITTTLTTITEFWRAHGEEIMGIVSFAFNLIATVIGGTLTLVSGYISAFITAATGIWSAGSALLHGDTSTAWGIIQTTVGTITETIKTTIATFMQGVLSLVGTDLATFTETWSTVFNQALTIVTLVWGLIVSGIQGFVDSIALSISTFVTGFITTWQTNFDQAKTIVDTVWGLIVSAIAGFISSIVTSVTTFVTGIVAQFNGIVTSITTAFSIDWALIGAGIIGGIASGIAGAVQGLANQAAAAAQAAFNAAKAALGIGSPSKLGMMLGENFGESLAAGITSAIGGIAGASRAASVSMLAPARAVAGGVSNASSTQNWNLSVNTRESVGSVSRDFAVMQALAGV